MERIAFNQSYLAYTLGYEWRNIYCDFFYTAFLKKEIEAYEITILSVCPFVSLSSTNFWTN
jgi:hypothetical protein